MNHLFLSILFSALSYLFYVYHTKTVLAGYTAFFLLGLVSYGFTTKFLTHLLFSLVDTVVEITGLVHVDRVYFATRISRNIAGLLWSVLMLLSWSCYEDVVRFTGSRLDRDIVVGSRGPINKFIHCTFAFYLTFGIKTLIVADFVQKNMYPPLAHRIKKNVFIQHVLPILEEMSRGFRPSKRSVHRASRHSGKELVSVYTMKRSSKTAREDMVVSKVTIATEESALSAGYELFDKIIHYWNSSNVLDSSETPGTRTGTVDRITRSSLSRIVPEGLASDIVDLLDLDDDGDISRDAFADAFKVMFDDREGLAKTLNDYENVVEKLDNAACVVVLVVLLFVILFLTGVDVANIGVSSVSSLVAFGFFFGPTAQRFFDGFILLFVTRPFDVGDRILFSSEEGTECNAVVNKLSLLTTEMIRVDGQVILVSNDRLSRRDIVNARRSGETRQSLRMTIHSKDFRISGALEYFLNEEIEDQGKSYGGASIRVLCSDVRQDGYKSTLNVIIVQRRNLQDHWNKIELRDLVANLTESFLHRSGITFGIPVSTCKLPATHVY